MNKPVAVLRLVWASMLALPVLAHAAGLGRLTVQSYLGQPLRAEIEVVSVQAGEETSLEARLASGNAFAQAGIEFNPALSTIRFEMEKRNGQPYIRVTTRQPVNEPFVDLLVELRWATGLFVREYTVLLDPPGYEAPKAAAASAPASMATAPATAESPAPKPAQPMAEAKPEARAETPAAPAPPMVETKPAPEAKAEAEAKPEAAPKPAEPPAAAATAPAPMAAGGMPGSPGETYEVKKGDTLGQIALKYRPSGVSFHQMLIALQRANEDAFIRSNINLVRAGRILNIPDAQAAAAVDPADATQLVIAQNAEFDEYRSRLGKVVAATGAAPKPAEQSAAGPISAKPEAPKPAATGDQLKLSRADVKKPGSAQSKAARADDLAARERALQEAQSRISDLEKNVADLKKLLELRNQQLAQLEQKAGTKPGPAAPAPKPSPAPAAAKPAAEMPKPAPAAEAPKPAAEAPKPAPAAPASGAAPTPAKSPAPAPAKPKPRPVVAPPPPPEPSLIDEFLDNPVALGGLGAVVVLLAGYGAWAWRRKKKSQSSKFQDSVLGPASVAGAGVEPSIAAPAGPTSVSQGSVSQSPVGGVETDDVDPIAEADVYMAYGRDAQAEEILKEALQKDPHRVPVLSKLLEIYANRRDASAFEETALKLKGQTSGTSPEWEKATALGRSIDPGNGLYGGGGAAPAAAPVAAAAAPVAAPAVDFDIGGGAVAAPEATPALDLDLGGGAPAAAEEKSDFSPGGTLIIDSQETKAASSGLDFDLGGGAPEEKPAEASGGGLNFELPGATPAAEPSAPVAPAPASTSGGLDFDLNLGGGDTKEPSQAAAPALDLSAISLDLGAPGEGHAAVGGNGGNGGNGNGNGDPKWQEVATKLDLAKAYEEMGDKDGAKELLNEVMREGDSAQQGQAQQLLSKLG